MLSLGPHHVLILKKWSGFLILSKNEPEEAFVCARNAHKPIRQRGALFGLMWVAIPGPKKAMATQAEGLLGYSAGTIPRPGVCHSSQAWPKLPHPGKNWPSTRTHTKINLIGLAYIWLIATTNKTYGCLKSNYWQNASVNDLTPQPIAYGCHMIGTFSVVYPICLQATFPAAYNSTHFVLNRLLCFHMFIISYQQPQEKNLLKMGRATKTLLGPCQQKCLLLLL